ncbi:oxygenase MpaB family protein [Jongsikchunia kroppenstedtii]|uniref:oxygenase MpaB family protein n=1 Tax=Jongsikchunia kroppenstedtii TaxID=1121721 RepID=UPI000382809C|nr:oxygenase MpaB family protein [Jongsikchunia kroppenstedtii]
MTTYYPELADRVRSQRALLPDVYGDLDFDTPPYRHTEDPAVKSSLPEWVTARGPSLADPQRVELIRTATMLGDVAADPYAALTATRSVTDLIAMLSTACREGVDAVADVPPELVAFIESMEATPDWIDMRLVEQGARESRMPTALVSPFVTRGAFIATFTNTYAALPMALTGALSGKRASRRVNETSNFFALTTLPGAMDRHGPGFEAAAMVRLMHSMVRYNALKRSDRWDADVYGMPVPQVDQMLAGLIGSYLLAQRVLHSGRTEFDDTERAVIEFSRYRCFLLGLPEELVPREPQEIVDMLHARAALLRDGFDDETCGALVRSTMAAYLRSDRTRFDRAADAVEKSYSKMAFTQAFCHGDRRAAARMGVDITATDFARIAITIPFISGRFFAVRFALRFPRLRPVIDRYLVGLIRRRLAEYGKPEFRTDAATYATAH